MLQLIQHILSNLLSTSITGADSDATVDATWLKQITQPCLSSRFNWRYIRNLLQAEAGGAILCDKTTTPEEITFADGTWTAGQSVATY